MYSSTQHTTLETSTTFYACTPHSPTRAISALSLNAYHRISTNWSSKISSRGSVPSLSRCLLSNYWNVWRYWRTQDWSTVIWNLRISFLNRELARVGLSWRLGYNHLRSKWLISDRHVTKCRLSIRTFNLDSIDLQRSCSVCHTRLLSICGLWDVLSLSFSLDYHFSREPASTTR